jgi:hypothetical protein
LIVFKNYLYQKVDCIENYLDEKTTCTSKFECMEKLLVLKILWFKNWFGGKTT